MSVQIEIDPISHQKLNKRFKLLGEHYPKETFKAIVAILFDIKKLAQDKIKSNGTIKTARLRNSIFVKTPKQIYAKSSSNAKGYTDNNGKSYSRGLDVNLTKFEGAVGTNVEYAGAIENGSKPHVINAKTSRGLRFKIGNSWITKQSVNHPGTKAKPFLSYAVKNVNIRKRFAEIPNNVKKKIK